MSDGEPFLRSVASGASERVLKQLLEPGLIIGAGSVCVMLSYRSVTPFLAGFYSLGLWLIFAAIAHGLYEGMLYEQRLHAYIDQIDAHIEGAATMEIMKQYHDTAKSEEGKGTVAPAAAAAEPAKTQPDLEATIGYPVIYDPAVQQMISDAREREQQVRGQSYGAGA
ncbi:MAG: hypothetical protein IT541_15605 [Hyphomicrobiales bacterium]|nr:hypothetical protein [Hyphomicrobiales bacterium]